MKKIIFRIDEDLHNKFKVKCAMNARTMTEVILNYIKKYVEERQVA